MNSTPVRLAVIGLGMASKPHLEALAQLSDTVVVSGVFNRSREKAERVGAQSGYRVFDNIDEIATDPLTEGAILLTPPHQRFDIVNTLALSGKHILTEKPVERSTEAAAQLVTLCERAGVIFGVVFQNRFKAGAQRLNHLIRAGELGDIAVVRADIPWWRDQDYYDVRGRGSYERDGGGVLISQAIHALDLMLSLTGPAATVQAFCATSRLHQLEAEDFATGGIRFASGAVGSVVATTATYPGGTETLVIDGPKATATLKGSQLNVVWRDGRTEATGELEGSGGTADPMAFPCDWHRELIVDFTDSIREQRSPRITGREALNVHALIDAMVASSRTGSATAVELLST